MKDDDNERVNLARVVKDMRENMPAHLDFAKVRAKLTRQKYLALVEEGFTKAEALELCWRM